MKKTITIIASLFTITTLFAQPVLHSDSLHTGLSFNLYSLSNVNTANLAPSGANVTWDLSTTTATPAGTADMLNMSDTPYETEFPNANFAIKFTSAGSSVYSLFNHTNSVFEEVANNVGGIDPATFINYRTALVFPFTFNLTNTDTYQKSTQAEKIKINTYDAYGTLITNTNTYNNVVRILIDDDGNASILLWRTAPLSPLFQASSEGFILWELTSTITGNSDVISNPVFDMYPNPATSELHIINKELISRIDIYSASGQFQFSTTKSVIDVSSLSGGLYFLMITTVEGQSLKQKFVKQ